MHCVWLLYILHCSNGDTEVGPDSRQVPELAHLLYSQRCCLYLVSFFGEGCRLHHVNYSFHSVTNNSLFMVLNTVHSGTI